MVNSGGRIEREYGLGRGRTDLFVTWPHGQDVQRFVIECKILRGGLEDTIRKGLIQTLRYMDQCAAREGHLVLFDRAKRHWKDRKDKVFRQSEAVEGTTIEVWGM